MMDDEEAIKESVGKLRDAILLGRSDIIRSILSTAAECKFLLRKRLRCWTAVFVVHFAGRFAETKLNVN